MHGMTALVLLCDGAGCEVVVRGSFAVHFPGVMASAASSRLLLTCFSYIYIHMCVDYIYYFIRAKRVSNCYMQEKKTYRLCGCLYVRLILVLVLGRQIVYGQNTVYLCLSKYIVLLNTKQYKHHVVRSIARSGVSPGGARSNGHHWCQAARTAATCT